MEKQVVNGSVKILLKSGSGEYVIDFERKTRLMIGSAESCDVTIVNDTISPIHLVIEYCKGTCTIYDMNSRFGTKVNGESTIKSKIKIGDLIELGTAQFKVAKVGEDIETPPPVLPSLKIKPGRKLPKKLPQKVILPEQQDPDGVYDLSYPLSKDPKADFTEYIFEDSERMLPIFNYELQKSAVEVIILFDNKILSVDYIPDTTKQVYITGLSSKEDDIEYPYLPKTSRDLFIELSETSCLVHPLYGHEMGMVGQAEEQVDENQPIELDFESILRFRRDKVQIFIRRTDAPPAVAHAPVFQDDPELRKYLAITLFFTIVFLAITSLFTVNKELEKEKMPERIATILYKRLPKKKRATPKRKIVKKHSVKVAKKVTKNPKRQRSAAKKPVAKVVKRKSKVVTRKKVRTAPKLARTSKPNRAVKKRSAKSTSKRIVSRSRTLNKSKGRVDVYRSSSFKSSLSSLLAKGGAAGNFQAKVVTPTSGEVGVRGSNTAGAFKKANVTSTVGSLSNATVGKIDQGSGVQGIVNKHRVGKASIPVETIVVGMDPNLIRQTLMQYLDQFRYCYQNALDTTRQAFSGVVVLDFGIAASGRVNRANATAKSGHLRRSVQRCVVNVLRKITFPAPPGGGAVDVRQPMNFYPKIL